MPPFFRFWRLAGGRCGNQVHYRSDVAENGADVAAGVGQNGSRGDGHETGHQGVLDHVLGARFAPEQICPRKRLQRSHESMMRLVARANNEQTDRSLAGEHRSTLRVGGLRFPFFWYIVDIMLRILTLLLLGSYAAAQAPVKAPDPAKAALIEELIVALKAEQNQQQIMQTVETGMLNQINQAMDSQLKTMGGGGAVDDEKRRQVQADVQEFQHRLFALMAAHMSWQIMKPVYVEMYDETFTTDELRPLVAFMKSPAGQIFVDKTPVLMANTMKRMQGVMAGMMPDIQKLNADFMQQMKQKYADKN